MATANATATERAQCRISSLETDDWRLPCFGKSCNMRGHRQLCFERPSAVAVCAIRRTPLASRGRGNTRVCCAKPVNTESQLLKGLDNLAQAVPAAERHYDTRADAQRDIERGDVSMRIGLLFLNLKSKNHEQVIAEFLCYRHRVRRSGGCRWSFLAGP